MPNETTCEIHHCTVFHQRCRRRLRIRLRFAGLNELVDLAQQGEVVPSLRRHGTPAFFDARQPHGHLPESAAAAVRRTSAATFLEASMVLESRHGADGVRLLDLLIESAGIEVVAVDFAQAKIARQAFAHFGKGRHPAGLNYGDCFAYALARQLGEPLLCKGDDFSRTDLALP